MLPFRPFPFFPFQELETPNYPVSRVPGENDIINVSPFCRQEGINIRFPVLFRSCRKSQGRIRGGLDLLPENNLRGALRPHDGNLRGWPGIVDVAADLF